MVSFYNISFFRKFIKKNTAQIYKSESEAVSKFSSSSFFFESYINSRFFFSTFTGGSFENRVRLLLELTSLVRQAWPSTKPLSVRLSCDEWVGSEGWTMEDTLRLIPQLIELGVDIIDTSSGGNSSSLSRNISTI